MPRTPVLTGQVIGQAHYATRAVLERELAAMGLTFFQSLALNAVAAEGGAVEHAPLVDRMTGALKVDESAVQATIDELSAAGLLRTLPSGGSGLALTDAGRARQRQVADGVAGIVARLYADIPAAELEVAGRVLTLLKQRADAELATA
ncbi:MarR family winged helix-turn-helix transcriptional regulator [Micromonospora coerulea]|uniref:MarR family winged helix-turn-helix transcriptional regulator n=1 Tax=Micromonospora coerulea TaxID=47856 RepID=UPI001906AB9A|nr:MarR family winged helix-turn-helix transcriptional regulator [Micromonospora veneta]